jgi:hypothetical protein
LQIEQWTAEQSLSLLAGLDPMRVGASAPPNHGSELREKPEDLDHIRDLLKRAIESRALIFPAPPGEVLAWALSKKLTLPVLLVDKKRRYYGLREAEAFGQELCTTAQFAVRMAERHERQTRGLFTMCEAAQALAEAQGLDAREILKRMEHDHREGKLIVRDSNTELEYLSTARVNTRLGLVKHSDMDAWLSSAGATYLFLPSSLAAHGGQSSQAGNLPWFYDEKRFVSREGLMVIAAASDDPEVKAFATRVDAEFTAETEKDAKRLADGYYYIFEAAKELAGQHNLNEMVVMRAMIAAGEQGLLTVRDPVLRLPIPKGRGTDIHAAYLVKRKDVNAWLDSQDAGYQWKSAQQEVATPLKPVQRQHSHQETILAKLRELNFNPQELPALPKGKRCVAKGKVKAVLVGVVSGFTKDVFKRAWQALHNAERDSPGTGIKHI